MDNAPQTALNETGPRCDPPHAYVPGQTARHPEHAFKGLTQTARPAGDADQLADCLAWRLGLCWLERGYFWEAHELLEAVWAALPPNSHERRLVQALIQLANSGLKARMGHINAQRRLLDLADQTLAECRSSGRTTLMGVRLTALDARIAPLRAAAGN